MEMRRRGKILLTTLSILEHLAISTAELVDIFTSGYSESYRKLRGWQQAAPHAKKSIGKFFNDLAQVIENEERLYHLIHRLKRDGLICPERKNSDRWLLTKSGEAKLAVLGPKLSVRADYQPEKSNQLIVVAFDVPERERWKRDWLRSVLKNLQLQQLQQSLWMGKAKLPKEFIEDLQKLRLISCVEIFAVTQTGTIKHLI